MHMIEYRELETQAEMRAVQRLEYRVWEMEPIPTHQTMTAVKNGGIMLGVFDNELLVGFSYGFAGFDHGKSYLCSHMMGLDAAYRSQGLGEQLKQKQREVALQKGYRLITWTFDPLESRNAYLNITKLHGICDTYIQNCYGDMTDKLNTGLPTDRLEVHWYIDQPHVEKGFSVSADKAVELNDCVREESSFPVNQDRNMDCVGAETYAVHIPNQFQQLKQQYPERALEWRLAVRTYFKKLFKTGYVAVELKRTQHVSTYYFVKKERLEWRDESSSF